MIRHAIVCAALLAACGPSSAEMKEAKESVYQTEYANVWNAVKAEMDDRYPGAFVVENAEKGIIETKWKSVSLSQDEAVGESNMQSGQLHGAVGGRDLFRMLVKIDGGPPWSVWVDGEAAAYRPDMAMLTPFKHGQIDEPKWVPGRIDGVRASIHRRLKQYAVKPGAVQAPPTAPTSGTAPSPPAEPAPSPKP